MTHDQDNLPSTPTPVGVLCSAPPTIADLSRSAASLFHIAFGLFPTHGAQAPGRINLIGEHIDYNQGIVLPMAMDRWCVGVASMRDDHRCEIVSQGHAGPLIVDPGRARPSDLPSSDWRRYVAGVLTILSKAIAPSRSLPGLRISIASSVPVGAGLSSSAALEVCIATLASSMWSEAIGVAAPSLLQLARICQHAEHTFARVPCGLMDQLASVVSVADHAIRIDCRENTCEAVAIPRQSEAVIVVCDSNVKHALGASAYAQRRECCESAARVLGVKSLRDVPPWLLRDQATLLDPDQRRCATHVVSEIQRVEAFIAALERNDLQLAGQLMLASHESLRRDYQVSCQELDALVDASMTVGGVFGSRLTGAGFGGCTVSLCRPSAVASLVEKLQSLSEVPNARAFVVFAVAGAGMFSPELGTDTPEDAVMQT